MATKTLTKDAFESKRVKVRQKIADILDKNGYLTMGVQFNADDPEETIDKLSNALKHWMRDKFTKTDKRPVKVEMRLNLVFDEKTKNLKN